MGFEDKQYLLGALIGCSDEVRNVSDVVLELVDRHEGVVGLVDVGHGRKVMAFELGQAQELDRRLEQTIEYQ